MPGKNTYIYNLNFFDIENEFSFYWAGFIAADGCVSKKGDFHLSLKLSDKHHIEKFKEHVQTNAPIKYKPPTKKVINNVQTITSGTSLIRFRAKNWSTSLQKFNIVPNKTKTFNIPEHIKNNQLFKHFIRGYFDGDGWFSLRNFKNKQRLSWGLCGNYDVLKTVQEYLQENCKIKKLPKIIAQNSIYKFEFQNQQDIKNIVDFLYSNINVYLDRKYELSKLITNLSKTSYRLNLDPQKLKELYKTYNSYKKLAEHLNVSVGAINKYINL